MFKKKTIAQIVMGYMKGEIAKARRDGLEGKKKLERLLLESQDLANSWRDTTDGTLFNDDGNGKSTAILGAALSLLYHKTVSKEDLACLIVFAAYMQITTKGMVGPWGIREGVAE